jgi:hypothetical protein
MPAIIRENPVNAAALGLFASVVLMLGSARIDSSIRVVWMARPARLQRLEDGIPADGKEFIGQR